MSYPDPKKLLRKVQEYTVDLRNVKISHILDSIAREDGNSSRAAHLMFELASSIGVVSNCFPEGFSREGDGSRIELRWCFNAGRAAPLVMPPNRIGFDSTNNDCWLDLANIRYQNPAEPIWRRTPKGGRPQAVLPQIRPFAPENGPHLVLASLQHEPQGWRSVRELLAIVQDGIAWARELPGWTLGYNGVGAGASNPNHWHYQALVCGRLPLLEAALGATAQRGSPALVLDYPIAAVVFTGSPEEVTVQFSSVAANLFALSDTGSLVARQAEDGVLTLVYVPRERSREFVTSGVKCRAGFLEASGVLLLKQEADVELLSRSEDRHGLIWSALASLEPPGIRQRLLLWRWQQRDGIYTKAE